MRQSKQYKYGYYDCADVCGCNVIYLEGKEKEDYIKGWNQACKDFPYLENKEIKG